jgi:hypothetical protein
MASKALFLLALLAMAGVIATTAEQPRASSLPRIPHFVFLISNLLWTFTFALRWWPHYDSHHAHMQMTPRRRRPMPWRSTTDTTAAADTRAEVATEAVAVAVAAAATEEAAAAVTEAEVVDTPAEAAVGTLEVAAAVTDTLAEAEAVVVTPAAAATEAGDTLAEAAVGTPAAVATEVADTLAEAAADTPAEVVVGTPAAAADTAAMGAAARDTMGVAWSAATAPTRSRRRSIIRSPAPPAKYVRVYGQAKRTYWNVNNKRTYLLLLMYEVNACIIEAYTCASLSSRVVE